MKQSKSKQTDDRKKRASEHLKVVDRMFKSGDFDGALQEVDKALEADPGNFYALAYLERITAAKKVSPAAPAADHGQPATPQKSHEKPRTQEEIRKKFLEDKRKAEELAKIKAEEDRRRAQGELMRRGQEVDILRQKEEEDRRRSEDARRRLEDELRRKDGEYRRTEDLQPHPSELPQIDAGRRADEERAAFELESRKKAELEAKRRFEDDLRKKIEDDQRSKEHEQLVLKGAEEGRKSARSERAQRLFIEAGEIAARGGTEEALLKLMAIFSIDPNHREARALESRILEERRAQWMPELEQQNRPDPRLHVEIYARLLKFAYSSGALSPEEEQILRESREYFQISDGDHHHLNRETQIEVYGEIVKDAWSDGTLDPDELATIEQFRSEFNISADQHVSIEQNARKELGL